MTERHLGANTRHERQHIGPAALVDEIFEVAVARLVELVLFEFILTVEIALELVLDNLIDGSVSKEADEVNDARTFANVFETPEHAV